MARTVMLIGAAIFLAGAVMWLLGRFNLPQLGRLPGDIAIERENFRFYFPITTSLLVSALLTLIFWLIRKF